MSFKMRHPMSPAHFDSSSVIAADANWWILNPEAPFRLHLARIDHEAALKFKAALERGMSLARDGEEAVLELLDTFPNVECHEINEYRSRQGGFFLSALRQREVSSDEWKRLVEMGDRAVKRRERLRYQFQKEIIATEGGALRYAPGLLSDDADQRARAFAEVLAVTYVFSAHEAYRAAQRHEVGARSWWLSRSPGGCCPDCRSMPDEYPAKAPPRLPFHVGCGCTVLIGPV